MPQPLSIAVLVGGGGRSLQNFIDHIADGSLSARIQLVIASKPGLGALEKAARANLPSLVETSSPKIFAACEGAGARLVCLAGWLRLLRVPPHFAGRVMNIHPALLPDFGGPGMYGLHAHEAVLAQRCPISGCTVHFVDDTYDTGPIILQRVCPVEPGDTPETLAHRVFEEEKIAYPQAINLFAQGRLHITGRQVRIDPA
jgi:phosphoribosylglycinamide formyltransferase 1